MQIFLTSTPNNINFKNRRCMEGIINKLMDHAEKHGEKKPCNMESLQLVEYYFLWEEYVSSHTSPRKRSKIINQPITYKKLKKCRVRKQKIETKKNAEIER